MYIKKKRTERLMLTLTKEEREAIEQGASAANTTLSDYVCRIVLGRGEIKRKDAEE